MDRSPRPPGTIVFGIPKLPARYAGIVMPLLLSVMMTFIVSFISTFRGVGWGPDLVRVWLGSWGLSWLVAFPTLLLALPIVRRATAALVNMG
ncbi:DUF2798 domain-containing protein [Aquincola sp. MAHUQ-54]|uniref:DUF2798 domain-containing protein n=1 Tax=Aquincola agrisoli TaxID=3119538 RepID=A0AAW9Q864_9BURK